VTAGAGPAWAWSAGVLAAGGLTGLAFAPFHFAPAYLVGLAVLIAALGDAQARARPVRSGFWRGWLFAFGMFLAGLNWVANAFFVDPDKFAALAIPALLALPGGLALFWGVAGALAVRIGGRGVGFACLVAGLAGLAELARSHVLTGFPWNLAGHIWPAGGAMSQTAALIGAQGLSALTLAAFALLAAGALAALNRRSLRAGAAPVVLGGALLGAMASFGLWRLAQPAPGPGGPVVAVVEAGYTQVQKWDPANALPITRTYLDLLDAPQARSAALIVWPEGALPYLMLDQPEVMAAIEARLGARVLAAGLAREDRRPDGRQLYNSLAVFARDARGFHVAGLYDKVHLVPFGEYVPFGAVFDALGLRSLVSYGTDFTPGPSPRPALPVPGVGPAAPLICYEAIFPGAAVRGADGPRWLLNVSVDAWFGTFAGPAQHFNQARYRAIEEGRPLVRAASGGTSAIVDSRGRVLASVSGSTGVAAHPLPAAEASPPPFVHFGAAGTTLILFALLASGFALRRRPD
jgi:apolipoprotein N-acyltransferase